MKKFAVVLVVLTFLCGCAAFGSFPSLEKGKSSKEDVSAMLGEPAERLYDGDKEVWKYRFLKEDGKKAGKQQTVMNFDITFKEGEVEDYKVTVSQVSMETVQEPVIREGEKVPPIGGRPDQPVRKGNFIQQFDSNNDGRVSIGEFSGPEQLFNHLDRNNDGYIDESEAPQGPPGGEGKGMQGGKRR